MTVRIASERPGPIVIVTTRRVLARRRNLALANAAAMARVYAACNRTSEPQPTSPAVGLEAIPTPRNPSA